MPPATTTPSWHDCRAGASSFPALARETHFVCMHRFFLIVSRRTSGSRDHGALGGGQKDIEPPQPPRHGARCLFKRTRASCRQKTHCAERSEEHTSELQSRGH